MSDDVGDGVDVVAVVEQDGCERPPQRMGRHLAADFAGLDVLLAESGSNCAVLELLPDGGRGELAALELPCIERMCHDVGRRAVLQGADVPEYALQHVSAHVRTNADVEDRIAFARSASVDFGMSHRAIAKLLGVSHPTVGKWIAEEAMSGSK